MQDDASDSLRVLLKFYKNFLAHFLRAFVFPLLHAMSYVARFCQMKDLIKIYIGGKFHKYSNCGCEVKKFQSFFIDSASMKILFNLA